MAFFTNKDNRRKFLFGRSMIEMIGVLAIIGLLSMLGLVGYKMAMNYYRANETMHDVMLRATNVPMKWETFEDKTIWAGTEFPFPEIGNRNSLEYPVIVEGEPLESSYIYRVDVTGVPLDVCKRIISMSPPDIDLIKVGGDAIPNPGTEDAQMTDCYLVDQSTINMSFYFGYNELFFNEEGDDDCTEPCSECKRCVNGTCQNKPDGTSCSNGCCENGICGTCQETDDECDADNPCKKECTECSSDGKCVQSAYGTSCLGGTCTDQGVCCATTDLTQADCLDKCQTLSTENGCPVCKPLTGKALRDCLCKGEPTSCGDCEELTADETTGCKICKPLTGDALHDCLCKDEPTSCGDCEELVTDETTGCKVCKPLTGDALHDCLCKDEPTSCGDCEELTADEATGCKVCKPLTGDALHDCLCKDEPTSCGDCEELTADETTGCNVCRPLTGDALHDCLCKDEPTSCRDCEELVTDETTGCKVCKSVENCDPLCIPEIRNMSESEKSTICWKYASSVCVTNPKEVAACGSTCSLDMNFIEETGCLTCGFMMNPPAAFCPGCCKKASERDAFGCYTCVDDPECDPSKCCSGETYCTNQEYGEGLIDESPPEDIECCEDGETYVSNYPPSTGKCCKYSEGTVVSEGGGRGACMPFGYFQPSAGDICSSYVMCPTDRELDDDGYPTCNDCCPGACG